MRGVGCAGRTSRRKKNILHVLAIAAFAGILIFGTSEANAQNAAIDQFQNITPEQVQQLFGAQNRGGMAPQMPNEGTEQTVLEPTAPANPVLARSRLEQILSARAGVMLSQFGYDELGVGRAVTLPQMGGVQDDYILGPGDEIIVTLRGTENAEYRIAVDRDGRVSPPRLNPISAAGRTLGDFRADLIGAIHRAYPSSDGFVTIGRLRQISVMVAGEVGSPGVRTLTGLSTPFDAILVSGGIKKSGSLRDVQLIHQGRTVTIDFYSLLTTGVMPRSIVLADGDRILVPPLTKVVAAAGWFRRPGIYELPPGQSAMSAGSLETLSGGLEVRGRYRLAVMRVEDNGQTQLATVTTETTAVRDGEVLLALPGANEMVGRAVLAGGTALAGSYAITDGMRLSDLLKAPGALGASPYTIFGIIARRDPRTYLRSLIAFSPVAALTGEEDQPLLDDDIVRVFSMNEAKLLSRAITQYEDEKEHDEEAIRNPYLAPLTEKRSRETGVAAANDDQQAPQTGQAMTPDVTPDDAMRNDMTQNGVPTAEEMAAPNAQSSAASKAASFESGGQSSARFGGAAEHAAAANSESDLSQGSSTSMEQTVPLANMTAERSPAPNFEQEVAPAGATPSNTEATSLKGIASQLRIDPFVLVGFLEDHEVTLDGAVRGPGVYVVGPGVNLHDLVMVAGGTANWADESGIGLITTDVDKATGNAVTVRKNLSLNDDGLASYEVRPHDELRFRQVFTNIGLGSVTLEGEVRFPGKYKIVRGEKLADLLALAGGLTETAYPYGTIYLRRSAAALEEASFRRTADQIESQLLLAMSRNSTAPKLDPSAFTATQGFIKTLRTQEGLGRISIEADPTLLAAQPDQNTLLEGGDVIYVPQRPNTVSVLGEVLQPGSFAYRTKLSAEDYLSKAGGSTAYADDSLTFVVLPDGSAVKLDRPWLPFDSLHIPPGSTIVVPRDIAPLQWSDVVTNASQIFSQLAVAGASLAVITSNLK